MIPPQYVRLGQHRLDPAEAHEGARRAGEFIANNPELTSFDDWLPVLLKQAQDAGYKGDLAGLRSRLNWTMRDTAAAVDRNRRAAESAIRRMAWPAMDASSDAAEILAKAQEINAQNGGILKWPVEVKAVLNEVAEQWLRRSGRQNGR